MKKSDRGFDPSKVCSSKVHIDAALLDCVYGNYYAAALAIYYANERGSEHRSDLGFEVHSVQSEWMDRAAQLFPGLPRGVHRYLLRYVFRTHRDPNVRWLNFGLDRLGMVCDFKNFSFPETYRSHFSVTKPPLQLPANDHYQ